MATYTTLENLKKRLDPAILAGLADDVNSPPDIGAAETIAVINQAIGDGASLIDSYVLGRCDLSSSAVQASLERANATLALYFLYRRRYLDDSLNPLALAREAVAQHLCDIAAGKVKLDDGSGSGTPEGEVFSTTQDSERELDPVTLGRFS
jgi:phage gp36-like protein